MLNRVFYHSLLRRYVIIFGACFRDIVVRRFDKSNNTVKTITVPIFYAPKEKWVVMLAEDQTKSTAITLPLVSFNNISWIPDNNSGRKSSPLNNLVKLTDKKNEMLRTFNAIPYKLTFELYIIAKYMDDSAQILEQILPYFNPDFTPSAKIIPSLDKTWDIPIRLTNISKEEAYDGDFTKRRVLIHTLSFELDVWLFGPIEKQGVIKRIQIDFNIPPGEGPITAEDRQNTGRSERMILMPGLTEDNLPTSDINETIPYYDIDEEDDYGFIEEIENFIDNKKYNPNTGRDEPIQNRNISTNVIRNDDPSIGTPTPGSSSSHSENFNTQPVRES